MIALTPRQAQDAIEAEVDEALLYCVDNLKARVAKGEVTVAQVSVALENYTEFSEAWVDALRDMGDAQ